jgi:hypothetical protein
MMMKVLSTSETPANFYEATLLSIPEKSQAKVKSSRQEKFKSHWLVRHFKS